MAIVAAIAGGAIVYTNFGAFLPWREATEADRLAAMAGVQAGQIIAEIGAGTGRFTVAMARHVGESGRVYSTELSAKNRDAIRARADASAVRNVTIVEGAPRETNLPDACCDVVFLRNVYHHVHEPDAFAASIRKAVRPGGRVVVIDFEPGALWLHGARPSDTAERRPGHGVARAEALAEFQRAGFRVDQEVPRWGGPMWLLLFRVQ